MKSLVGPHPQHPVDQVAPGVGLVQIIKQFSFSISRISSFLNRNIDLHFFTIILLFGDVKIKQYTLLFGYLYFCQLFTIVSS